MLTTASTLDIIIPLSVVEETAQGHTIGPCLLLLKDLKEVCQGFAPA